MESSALAVGILIAALGLTTWLVTRLLLRVPSRTGMQNASLSPSTSREEDGSTEPAIVIEPGGRVISINSAARRLFQLPGTDLPNLESLSRRLRPSELFIALCSTPGSGLFVVGNQDLEVISYRVSLPGASTMVLTFRNPTASGDADRRSVQAAPTFLEAMAADLELEPTVLMILQNLKKLVPADIYEITIWDPEKEHLIPFRLIGSATNEPALDAPPQRYQPGEGYSGYLAAERSPLLIEDVETQRDIRQSIDRYAFPLRSYVGIPLQHGRELIGTLELGSVARGAFQQDDLDVLTRVAPQATVALYNTLLFNRQQRRTAELSELSELAQVFTTVTDTQTMYERLVNSLAPLLQVEILGFLIYNEATRVLQGRAPIRGLPANFLDLYSADVPLNSPLEAALVQQDMILTTNAMEDAQWEVLGLDHLARGASLRDTALIPLNAGGHALGYLQASNHTDGSTSFSKDELHLLMIVANQAAAIIENAHLVQQSRQRAQRAEALRRVTSLASSAATTDEILKFSIQELARLLRADAAFALVLDADRKTLSLHGSSVFGDAILESLPQAELSTSDAQFPFSLAGGQSPRIIPKLAEAQAVIPFYQQLLGALGMPSLVGVPLVVRDEGIGELWFASYEANFFNQTDLQTLSTAAGQLAGVVEQSFLVAQTDESLRRQVDQLTALTRISRELGTSLDLKSLLQLVYSEALRITRADGGSIILFDLSRPAGEPPIIRYSVGDSPLETLGTLEQQAMETGETVILPDTAGTEFAQSHPGVESALIVPILYHSQPAGLLLLHARSRERFDEESIEITRSLAGQAAVALGNAFEYEEQLRRGEMLKRQLETRTKLFQVSQVLRPDQPLKDSLQAIAAAIQEVTRFQAVLISRLDLTSETLERILGLGIPEDSWQELKAHQPPWRGIESLLQPEFRYGNVYFIPADRAPIIPEDVHLYAIPQLAEHTSADAWDPNDFLVVPLFDSSGHPLGTVGIDVPLDGRRPDRQTLEALDLLAMQVGLVLENHRHVDALEQNLEVTSQQARQAQEAMDASMQSLPTLLSRNLEHTLAIHRLQQTQERIRSGLEIAEEATRQSDVRQVLHSVAVELLNRMGMNNAIIGEQTPDGARILEVVGVLEAGVNPEALFGQKNPLRQILLDGQPLLAASLDQSPEWKNTSLLHTLKAQGIIALPFTISENQRFGILAVSQRPLPEIMEEDRQMYDRLIRQVTVTLQNRNLLEETSRHLQEVNLLLAFSRKLGSLDTVDILNALVDSVMQVLPGAQAAWAGLADQGRHLLPQAASGFPEKDELLAIRFPVESDSRLLPVRVLQSGQTQRIAELNFAREYTLPPDDLVRYRHATSGRLPVSSMVVPIQIFDRPSGVIVVDQYSITGAFAAEDEALVVSLAQQTALALENARLYQAAGQRAAQLQALTQVSGALTASLQSTELIDTLLDQLGEVVPYETATLWLRSGESLTVAAASGFSDAETRLGISVEVEDSVLFQQMVETGQAISVPDVRQDVRFPSLLEPEFLSWLAIPLISKGNLVGLVALEKREPGYYHNEHIQAGTTFASQAAVALENARLFEESTRRTVELDQRSQRLALLNRLSGELTASLDVDYILKLTSQQLMSAMGAQRVAAVMSDDEHRLLLRTEVPPGEGHLPRLLPPVPMLDRLRESRGIFSTSDVLAEPELKPLVETYLAGNNTHSLLIVPILTGTEMHGWFLIQMSEAYKYSIPEIELARTITNQAAIAIQNARLFAETTRLKEDLEKRVDERTAELTREHQNSQTLLQLSTELSASLDIDQVLARTLGVLNETIGAEQSLIWLSGNPQRYLAGESLADPSVPGAPEVDIARWVTRKRAPALLDDVATDARWSFPVERTSSYASVLAVPLSVGEDVLGALLLMHRKRAAFQLEQVSLLEAAARQISVTINNAELFNLIRDQAENMGSLLREQQIEASRMHAILDSVADGVLVTNAENNVTLFNPSAQRILNLTSNQIVGHPLEEFRGLFGSSAQSWFATIQAWLENPQTCVPGEVFSEQIELETGQIVSIQLAPVIWRTVLLGTVSTFRDITHEVQVDRLKSEFVANVSHELRTPMTSIKGYVDVMLMGAAGQLTAQQKHFLEVVKSSAERLTILINDLLDLSRVETGRVKLVMQPVDVLATVQNVLTEMRTRSQDENRPMTFLMQAPETMPLVLGDQERVHQIIANLVRNGYIYTPENGHVTVRVHRLDNEVQVDVVDDGVGIAPKDHPRIFERFYRGDHPLVLASAGTGLGLAMAKTLVEMHNGRIWFSSSGIPGEGSVFSFTLPIQEMEE